MLLVEKCSVRMEMWPLGFMWGVTVNLSEMSFFAKYLRRKKSDSCGLNIRRKLEDGQVGYIFQGILI